MKFQLALDDITLAEALALLSGVAPYVDIIEVGTPLLLEYGMTAVRVIKEEYPHKEILCDAKIMDGGTIEANAAFRAGADYITVLAVTDRATLNSVALSAKSFGKCAVADLMCVQNLKTAISVLEETGIDMAAVHVGVDQQRSGRTPMQDLIALKQEVSTIKTAVAGGINLATIDAYIAQKPDVIIVGGGIVHAKDPAAEAAAISKRMKGLA